MGNELKILSTAIYRYVDWLAIDYSCRHVRSCRSHYRDCLLGIDKAFSLNHDTVFSLTQSRSRNRNSAHTESVQGSHRRADNRHLRCKTASSQESKLAERWCHYKVDLPSQQLQLSNSFESSITSYSTSFLEGGRNAVTNTHSLADWFSRKLIGRDSDNRSNANCMPFALLTHSDEIAAMVSS